MNGMNLKGLRKKTWIDWVKILVAIDIVFVGIGLILNIHTHLLADILGFLTRIPFGILYILIGFIIFRKVFPEEKNDKNPKDSVLEISEKYQRNTDLKQSFFKSFFSEINSIIESILNFVDRIIDSIEDFFKKRSFEIKDELEKISKE